MTTATATASKPVRLSLVLSMLAVGWAHNPPPHITAETLEIDAATIRGKRCGKCNRKRLALVPMHKGKGGYRCVSTCKYCGDQYEL